MGQIKFVVAMVMAALFAIAIVSYGLGFGNDNNVAVDLGDDAQLVTLNSTESDSLISFKDDINSSSASFFSSAPSSGDELLQGGGQFKVGIVSSTATMTGILRAGFAKIFGKDNGFGIFLTSLSTLLALIGFLYVYKTWKGNPD